MWNLLLGYAGYKSGEHIGKGSGKAGFFGAMALFIILFKWKDWFQPLFDQTGITNVLKDMGIVRDSTIETLITIFLFVPIFLLITFGCLILISRISYKILKPVFKWLFNQTWFQMVNEKGKWLFFWSFEGLKRLLFFPYFITMAIYGKVFHPEEYQYQEQYQQNHRLTFLSRKKALYHYVERYAHDPSLLMKEQDVFERINRVYQEHNPAELWLAYKKNGEDEQLYFLTNTVDLYPSDYPNVTKEPHSLGFKIEFENVCKEKTAYVPVYQDNNGLYRFVMESIPLSTVVKARLVHFKESRFKELAHLLRTGEFPPLDSIYTRMNGKKPVVTAKQEWEVNTEQYTIEKKELAKWAQRGSLTDALESYVYRRLGRMQAKDDDLALLMIQGQELYYILKHGDRIYPRPIHGIEKLQNHSAVQAYLNQNIDESTLLEQLEQEGYNTQELFGEWLEWSA